MAAPSKTPPHGTRERYRLELKLVKAGKLAAPCDRCKSANARAARAARADRAARTRRGAITLVGGTQSGIQDEDTASSDDTSAGNPPAEPGDAELAVRADLARISQKESVPFFATLEALAIQAAKEMDSATSATARAQASRQLFEVVKRLQGGGEDDAKKAVQLALDFGDPLVPGVPA